MTEQELLIPVGHDIGVLYSGSGGADQRRQQVRVGVELFELADAEFAVWVLAHGADDEDRPTRASLTERAERLGLPVDGVIERFLADGLLVAVDPTADAAIDFAQAHQLFPLMHGLGADPDQPWLQSVGLTNRPIAQVSNTVYDVWVWAHLAPELWTGCHHAAKVAEQVGSTSPEETDPRQVLTGVLGQVHGLLCVRAAYFDRRRKR
ncbi:hypothetical protein AB0L70_09285 [Kribbella sp. NPDC051952]|uniref:hypothetical protein n=1 Tax=Kribbella sp. NPDC051952 TaxID=3154851 RepID=UPI0034389A35